MHGVDRVGVVLAARRHLRRRDGPLRRARPGLPAAREHRRPSRARQPLVVGPRDPGRDPQAAAARRPDRPGVQLGHVRPDGALRDRQRDAARLLDPRDAAVGECGEGLERRADECPRPAAVRSGGPASLRRHVRQRGRRHPAAGEPLDGVERAEQPRLPQAAVPSYRDDVDDPVGTRLREDVQRDRPGDQVDPADLEGRVRWHRAAREQQPELEPPVGLAAPVRARDEGGRRRRVSTPTPITRTRAPPRRRRRRSPPASGGSSRPPSRSATSTRS